MVNDLLALNLALNLSDLNINISTFKMNFFVSIVGTSAAQNYCFYIWEMVILVQLHVIQMITHQVAPSLNHLFEFNSHVTYSRFKQLCKFYDLTEEYDYDWK